MGVPLPNQMFLGFKPTDMTSTATQTDMTGPRLDHMMQELQEIRAKNMQLKENNSEGNRSCMDSLPSSCKDSLPSSCKDSLTYSSIKQKCISFS